MGKITKRGEKTIRLPISESEYVQFLSDNRYAHEKIQDCIVTFPELFPREIKNGYHLRGTTESSIKIEGFQQRRISLVSNGEYYAISPCFVMPYMLGKVNEIDKGLVLVGAGTPYHIITYVCGKNDSFWQRCGNTFSRCSIVGTTVRNEASLPEDIVADEKHTRLSGEKSYIPTIAGNNCLLGADICMTANTEDLTAGYSTFKDEARNIKSDYSPKTVNTDGWEATEKSFKSIFPGIVVILCYLHSFIKVRDCCRKMPELLRVVSSKIWKTYKADNKISFSQRLRRLKEWAQTTLKDDASLLENVLKLCRKRDRFSIAYDTSNGKRTSNMVDRLMRCMSVILFRRQYFKGDLSTARDWVRSYCLIRNFMPICTRRRDKNISNDTLATRLNGFSYVDNWLENLIVCTSLNGYRQ